MMMMMISVWVSTIPPQAGVAPVMEAVPVIARILYAPLIEKGTHSASCDGAGEQTVLSTAARGRSRGSGGSRSGRRCCTR